MLLTAEDYQKFQGSWVSVLEGKHKKTTGQILKFDFINSLDPSYAVCRDESGNDFLIKKNMMKFLDNKPVVKKAKRKKAYVRDLRSVENMIAKSIDRYYKTFENMPDEILDKIYANISVVFGIKLSVDEKMNMRSKTEILTNMSKILVKNGKFRLV